MTDIEAQRAPNSTLPGSPSANVRRGTAPATHGAFDPDRLASKLEGRLVGPTDAAFDQARRAWNLRIDQRPAAVVFPESADDVANAVRFARQEGLRVAAQGTGHNAGPLGPVEDTVLVKTERMRHMRIDAAQRTARVEAGVVWGDVVAGAAEHDLAALAGSSPNVGVVGYLLGGGLSFLGRRYGLAANHVHAIELVTAEGRPLRADRDHEPDLFWALRGGGGSFGIVTAVEFELFPHTEAYAGVLWYPIQRGSEVLGAWGELTRATPPDELTTVARFVRFPAVEDIPEPVRGQSFVIVAVYHLGVRADADESLSSLRALGPVSDTLQTIPVSAISAVFPDPDQPIAYLGDSLMVADLPAGALDAFVEVAGAPEPSPLLSVELRHLEGGFQRPDPGHGALGSIDASYVMYAVGMTPVPELAEPVRAQLQSVKAALGPWAAPRMFPNLTETPQPPGAFWTDQTLDRLRRIKTVVDPDDVIRANHPIPPLPPGAPAAAVATRPHQMGHLTVASH